MFKLVETIFKRILLKKFIISEQFCKKNEVFLECGQAPEVVKYCWLIINPRIEITDCSRGCYCEKGYTRLSNDDNSLCVQDKLCK